MESQIQDYLRIGLSAKHKSTGQVVHFPMVHIVVENYIEDDKTIFIATCLEYSQAYESDKPQTAVAGVINLMHEYFLTSIKRGGMQFIFDSVESQDNDELWGKVRRFLAEKYRPNLLFVEKSFSRTTKEELRKLAQDIIRPIEMIEVVPKDHHDQVTSLKDEIV